MKLKLALAALSACTALTFTAAANATMVCPFTDHFFIKSPQPLHVVSTSVEGNLNFTPMSEDYFRLSCKDVRVFSGGVVTLDIGRDSSKCTIKIEDGPYQMNPTIKEVTCAGSPKISFAGMDHPYGSSDYFLKFAM